MISWLTRIDFFHFIQLKLFFLLYLYCDFINFRCLVSDPLGIYLLLTAICLQLIIMAIQRVINSMIVFQLLWRDFFLIPDWQWYREARNGSLGESAERERERYYVPIPRISTKIAHNLRLHLPNHFIMFVVSTRCSYRLSIISAISWTWRTFTSIAPSPTLPLCSSNHKGWKQYIYYKTKKKRTRVEAALLLSCSWQEYTELRVGPNTKRGFA